MTASGRFLARLRAWADERLRAAGVPADVASHYGGVAEAIVARATRETPLRGDLTATVQRLVDAEIAAHTRGSA